MMMKAMGITNDDYDDDDDADADDDEDDEKDDVCLLSP